MVRRRAATRRRLDRHACAGRAGALSCPAPAGAGAGVEQLIRARRHAIRGIASQHEIAGIRWWPPTASPGWLDFLVEGVPDSLPAFRVDLERALGCRVAIYLADQMPADTRRRIATEAVAV